MFFICIYMFQNLFDCYRPTLEQGTPSELTAAVLNLPRRDDDWKLAWNSSVKNTFTTKWKISRTAKVAAVAKPIICSTTRVILDMAFKKHKPISFDHISHWFQLKRWPIQTETNITKAGVTNYFFFFKFNHLRLHMLTCSSLKWTIPLNKRLDEIYRTAMRRLLR